MTALGPVSLAALAIVGIITLIGFLSDNWSAIWGAIEGISRRSPAPLRVFTSQSGAGCYPRAARQGHPVCKKELGQHLERNQRHMELGIRGHWASTIRPNWGWLLPGGPLVKAILFAKENWDTIWAAVQATWETVSNACDQGHLRQPCYSAPLFGAVVKSWDVAIRATLGALSSLGHRP